MTMIFEDTFFVHTSRQITVTFIANYHNLPGESLQN